MIEYDQEIPQSQTADNPVAPRGRAAQPQDTPGRQIKQSNQLSLRSTPMRGSRGEGQRVQSIQ